MLFARLSVLGMSAAIGLGYFLERKLKGPSPCHPERPYPCTAKAPMGSARSAASRIPGAACLQKTSKNLLAFLLDQRRGEGHRYGGLAVVYSMVTRHGGMIGGQSQMGQDTEFTIWLPLEEPQPFG
ncbi:hypothetical protein [Desulfosoma caldarium]|uniref:Uncharacterized protein n=1 Tax=Desulfosoma caldarium TaxID=610254 RepID=A0A3N1UMF1_9BACT|nr:hypothetical protein [Desulfosoma caldarium]ROQ89890.1 hypothetical protein EDC27_3009 [Desulfosoma caldarium]